MVCVAFSALTILSRVAGFTGLALSALVMAGLLTPDCFARSLADHILRAISRRSRSTLTMMPVTLVALGCSLVVIKRSRRAMRQPNNVTSPNVGSTTYQSRDVWSSLHQSPRVSAPRSAPLGLARSWTHNLLVVRGQGKRRGLGTLGPDGFPGNRRYMNAFALRTAHTLSSLGKNAQTVSTRVNAIWTSRFM